MKPHIPSLSLAAAQGESPRRRLLLLQIVYDVRLFPVNRNYSPSGEKKYDKTDPLSRACMAALRRAQNLSRTTSSRFGFSPVMDESADKSFVPYAPRLFFIAPA